MRKLAIAVMLLVLLMASLAPRYLNQAAAQPMPTLYWGSSGSDVAEVQRILRDWGYYDGQVDGQFGNDTAQAVRYFQSANGLAVDGVVGPATWAGLGYGAAAAADGGGAVSRPGTNIDLLARLIRAEAEAEPYEGKVAVAAVMLNRVGDSRFPKTLEGVIYEPDAFESVTNGRIYATPPTQEDYQAARDAVNGWDPTYGAVFFWNPATATSPWVWSRPIITQIGSHVFAH